MEAFLVFMSIAVTLVLGLVLTLTSIKVSYCDHDYTTEKKAPIKTKYGSAFHDRTWTEKGVLKIEKCSECGDRRALEIFSDERKEVELEYAEEMLNGSFNH